MTNWVATIDIGDEWQKADNNEITPLELTRILIKKLKELPYPIQRKNTKSYTLAIVLESLQELVENDNTSEDDFDQVMSDLYDWADEAKVWIKTIV